MLDQGLEADVVSDIQKYLENLINNGLRQRLISLIKVWNGPLNFVMGFGWIFYSVENLSIWEARVPYNSFRLLSVI